MNKTGKAGKRKSPRRTRRLPHLGLSHDILEKLPLAIYTCDAQGAVTYFNRAAADLWGREPVIGKDLWCGSWKIFNPDDGTPLPLDECPMALALREGRAVRGVEILIERPDGTRRLVRPHPDPILDAAGNVIGAYNLLLDVTEESAAAAMRSRVAAIVESSDDTIIGKDLSGKIMSWNKAAERMFGYTAEEAIGQSITMLIPEDRLDEEPKVLAQIRSGERIEHFETIRRRKDGSLINISLSISPVYDAHGRIVGASKIARDISQRIRTEKALKDADRRKDEFLATLAHELRNPLAPLKTSVEMLKMSSPGDTSGAIVEVMDRQISHLVRLVDDLLEVSRITRGVVELKKEQLPVDLVLQGAVEISKSLIEENGHRLEISLVPEALMVHGDRTRLTQVIANLLNNAAKFTPRNGVIRLVLERDSRNALIRILDNGIGITADKLDKVFEMFTQLRGAGHQPGLGIGLALSRTLIHLHGGTIDVRSEGENRGAEFIVRVPLAAQRVDVKGKKSVMPVAAGQSSPRRILVVDDNRDAANSLALLLRMLDHDVHIAHSGAEAIALAEKLRPDLMLLDIGMPDMDGHEVTRILRGQEWGKSLVVVALTGWAQESDRKLSAASGFDHHLVKPVAYSTLQKLLRESESRAMH